jgi:hypothetical protein
MYIFEDSPDIFSLRTSPSKLSVRSYFRDVSQTTKIYFFSYGPPDGPPGFWGYCKSFPMKTTRYNLSSLKHAKICFEEAPLKDKPMLKRLASEQPWYYYVRYDNMSDGGLALLQWTRSIGCRWDIQTSAFVSKLDARTCSNAAKLGDLEVLQ